MTNNDILIRLRYVFDIPDHKISEIFNLAGGDITQDHAERWLKKEEDPWFKKCSDVQLATFLNGFIITKRGKREGSLPLAEKRINNNIILRKLKIALDLKSDDILEILALANLTISEHELSAFFRKPGHKHFRECKDQVLRNFIDGLRLKHRP